jgi:ApaG protein
MIMDAFFQHTATTHGITVRVAVSYLADQSEPEAGKWFWAYHIRIENGGEQAVQLKTRHWRITDASGRIAHVDGAGVVGEQPVLSPGATHDYVSGCPLGTPYGSMEGFYGFEDEDGNPLEVRIPFFPLSAVETAP